MGGRFPEIDFARGIAVTMMAAFHFLWDVNYFFGAGIALYSGFFGLFQTATAGLFLLIAGISLTLSYHRRPDGYERRFVARGAKIFAMGLLITLFTLVFFPTQFIFFGALHLIGVSVVLAALLVRKKRTCLILGSALILGTFFFNPQSLALNGFEWLGLGSPRQTLDFFPLIPWFGAVLLGISAGHALYPSGKRRFGTGFPGNACTKAVNFLGKNSLLVYFAHQPVLFALFFIAKALLA